MLSVVRAGLIVGGVAAVGAGIRVATTPIGGIPPLAAVPIARTDSTTPIPETQVDSAAELAIADAPFRARRVAAAVAYDPARAVEPVQPVAPPVPKPVLVLSGIVRGGGTDPVAVLEGVPGAQGTRVMERGDTAGGVKIVRITPKEVVVTGFDTTWTLTVRTPW